MMAAAGAAASPEAARRQMAERLEARLSGMAPAEYARGASAFDPAVREAIEANATATATVVEAGKRLATRKFGRGRSIAGCFPNGGRRVAATYPQYDTRLKRIVTLEMAVNQCLKAHGEPLLDPTDPQTMGAITAYLRSLATGQKIALRMPAAAAAPHGEGERLYATRLGQRNYACASCHVQGAGKRFDGRLLSPPVGQAARWPFIAGGAAVTLQAQIRECLERMGAAPFPAGSGELNHLEYYLTSLSQGLPIRANEWRPASP